ncbi:MAG: Bax inhibitor-1/YccA family protein [Endomicrobium sp.]|jgi:uncharacterized YccA/Bax inhibitor family protein|nr:Bax inhibitor-1/YccA family protein [Endomicrobium sp.]
MSNPLLKNNTFFQSIKGIDDIMTIQGVVNKSIILWILLAMSSFYSWVHPNVIAPLLLYISFMAFFLAIVLIFKKTTAPFLSPLYAICEGFILGSVSLYFEKLFHGIVFNGIFLTICSLFCILAAYKTGMLRATSKFRKILMISVFTISFVYIIDFFLNLFFGGNLQYLHNSSNFSIAISFIITIIASFSLVIDFDLIEQSVQYGLPKYMEWYSAFSIMVTLIWLYIEIIRLLFKLNNRN